MFHIDGYMDIDDLMFENDLSPLSSTNNDNYILFEVLKSLTNRDSIG